MIHIERMGQREGRPIHLLGELRLRLQGIGMNGTSPLIRIPGATPTISSSLNRHHQRQQECPGRRQA